MSERLEAVVIVSLELVDDQTNAFKLGPNEALEALIAIRNGITERIEAIQADMKARDETPS